MGQQARIDFPITSEIALYNYVKHRFGVSIPNETCCANHPTSPWRAFADAYFANQAAVHIWKASRGFGGKSYLESVYGATCADTLAAEVKLLGGSGAQSRRIKEHMTGLWMAENFPVERILGNTNVATKLTNGGSVEALMASAASVRGPHPQRLLLDEVDEMEVSIIDAAMGQPMSKITRYGFVPRVTVMASTQQYADGPMAEMFRRAKKHGWVVHEWCYRASLKSRGGWLDDSEVQGKRAEITEAMWKAEYEGQEPNPGNRAINPDRVKAMFDRKLGVLEGPDDMIVRYEEWEAPQSNGVYATGTDWGRKVHFTEIVTWRVDVRPIRLVAYERTKGLPWPVIVAKFRERIIRYGGDAAHDATGVGDAIDFMLVGERDVAEFVGRAEYLELEQIAEPVVMVGQLRQRIFNDMIVACERGDVISPFIEPLYKQFLHLSNDDIYKTGGHPPDGFVAASLGWRAYLNPLRCKPAWGSA